ncbi:hypothetical protein [Pseudarthrobacter sp. NBSH8]|uniref:hypothetical protein n=1 Tax=Pseudarthrobacter sp. NBSH8 TaxID=2596911 RepID=UPI002106657E|nr:hypothetical protein [Pseudarthrobacter sp. NBSH8]
MDADGSDALDQRCRHDFTTDTAFDLVVGVAAGDVSLEVSAGLIAMHLVRR